MKNILTITLLLTCGVCYCSYDDSTFIDKCYFSDDGKWALVSELDFVRLRDNSDRFPVFGLYKSGESEPNNNIAVSEDSVYFFNDTILPSILPRLIDSVFEKRSFLAKYHFELGTNVTQSVKIEIAERFIREVNTITLLKLEQFTGVSHSAANTKYFDYFLKFFYNGRVIFTDTLLNSYADKQHLIEGLNEIERKESYTKDENLYIGTEGYGTRIYTNSDKTLFFIRTKYDVSNYVVVSATWRQINPITSKDEIVNTTVDHLEDPKEIRVLTKTSR